MSYINALNLFELKDGYSIEELKQNVRLHIIFIRDYN